jgi:hypothetical protein
MFSVHAVGRVCWQVLLCVLARALVMWDSVAPSEAWLQAQLPTLIKVHSGSGPHVSAKVGSVSNAHRLLLDVPLPAS